MKLKDGISLQDLWVMRSHYEEILKLESDIYIQKLVLGHDITIDEIELKRDDSLLRLIKSEIRKRVKDMWVKE